MTALQQRVQAVLGSRGRTPWEDLVRLFRQDAEAFYLLASADADDRFPDLKSLASGVRSAIRKSYEIVRSDAEAKLVAADGFTIAIPLDQLSDVEQFLLAVDGKGISPTGGKDYVGQIASEAEMLFKLGDRSAWEADLAKLRARSEVRPLVLRIHSEEVDHLAYQPAFITHSLVNCARRTVLAPTSIFKGLNRGDDCPTDLKKGWAFCGKPRQAFDNNGRPFPAPADMVYMVYADEAGFVFDWDWVKESPGEPGYPIDWQLRFGDPHRLEQDVVLELPTNLGSVEFDAKKACYSSRGDCIFCYMTDEVASAIRINADLTVFKSLSNEQHTGFKVKNVRRILEVDHSIDITDDPDIVVSVEAVLLASREKHPETSIDIYNVLINLRQKVGEPPTVRLPQSVG